MGKQKFRLSVQRKNHERKRWGYFPVRIPIKGGISVFKVSVPLSSLSSEQRTALQGQPVIRPPATCSSSTHFFPSLLPGQRTPLQVQPVTTPSAILSSSTQTPCLSSLPSTSSDDRLFPGEHVHNSYNTET